MIDAEIRKIKETMEGMTDEQKTEAVKWIDDRFLFDELKRRYGDMKTTLQSVGKVLGELNGCA